MAAPICRPSLGLACAPLFEVLDRQGTELLAVAVVRQNPIDTVFTEHGRIPCAEQKLPGEYPSRAVASSYANCLRQGGMRWTVNDANAIKLSEAPTHHREFHK